MKLKNITFLQISMREKKERLINPLMPGTHKCTSKNCL